MTTLNLTIPEHTSDPKDVGLDLRPENLERWLSELPLANADLCADSLLGMLNGLNQCRLKPNKRYQLLQLMQPATEDVLETLRNRYIRTLLPLPRRYNDSYQRAQGLSTASATAFKILVQDLMTRSHAIDDANKLLLNGLYMAIHYLSLKLLDSYLVYFLEPPNIWREIHQLYHFAEQGAIHDIPILQPDQNGAIRTIALAYKRAILLALSNPYHLMQEEAYTVFKLLYMLAAGCQITRQPEEASGCFYVDLKADGPPRFTPQAESIAAKEPRIVDLSRLLGAIQKRLEELSGHRESETVQKMSRLARRMQRDMLVRLEDSWGRKHDRKHERHAKLGHVQLTVSLSACHHYIGGKRPYTPELDEIKIHTGRIPGKRAGLSLVPLDFEHWKSDEEEQRFDAGIRNPRSSTFDTDSAALDIWQKIYATKSRREAENDEQDFQRMYAMSSWDCRNQSAEGLCLFCQARCSMPVRVGEIIAYESQSEGADAWVVANIRWVHVLDNESLELGVMLLSESARSVAARAIKGVGQGGEYVRTLLAPNVDLGDPNATLIAPGAIYDVGTELAVNTGDAIHYVLLTKLLGASQSYSQFLFKVLDNAPVSELQNIKAMREIV